MKDQVTWFYPEIEPYNTGRLQAPPVHETYFEESGNPSGKPVVFLDGGPGSGSEPQQRRYSTLRSTAPSTSTRAVAARALPTHPQETTLPRDSSPTSRNSASTFGIDLWQLFQRRTWAIYLDTSKPYAFQRGLANSGY